MMPVQLLVFHVDAWRIGVPVEAVLRVERACEVTPLPGAPPAIAGAVDVHGRIAAVIDMRRRLGLQARPTALSDALAILCIGGDLFALQADDVEGVIELAPECLVDSGDVMDGIARVKGLAHTAAGLLIVEDPEQFLDARDMEHLRQALESSLEGVQ